MEKELTLPEEQITIPETSGWTRLLPAAGAALGLAGLAASYALGGGEEKVRALYAYLVAFMYFLSIGLGGLFFVLLHHLARSGWSVVVRRLAEHVSATLWLFVPLFLPIAWNAGEIFEWMHAEGDPLLEHKAPYLNPTFFFVRAFVFFAVWVAFSYAYRRASIRQDESGDTKVSGRLRTFSAIGMVLFAFSLNYSSIDWMMSLHAHWFSTIFGVYFFAGSVVAILAAVILLSMGLQASGYLRNIVTAEHYHDLGKLLFAFVVFWAYIAFSQFMLIWYGNLPEETTFFGHRWNEGWQNLSIFLAAGHFALPFLYLLSSDVKRRRATLAIGAVWMLFMHLVDIHWLILPSLPESHGFHPQLVDLTTLVGVGGLFLAVVGWNLKGRRLVPVRDPRLAESLAFENM